MLFIELLFKSSIDFCADDCAQKWKIPSILFIFFSFLNFG